MTKTTLRRLLPLAWALGLLLLAQPALGQKQGGRHAEAAFKQRAALKQAARHEGPKTPPIGLSEITIEFFVQDDAGQFSWQSPDAGEPNVIPAGAQRLRFTARVNNRPAGSTVRLRATLQELCPSPDQGKQYLASLRHLTESDPTGEQTDDKADDELRRIQRDGKVSIEIPVHCEECVRASCGKECPGRDHLGEGPHVVVLTTSDPQSDPVPRAARGAAPAGPAKPSSFRLDVKSVCPKPGAKRPGR
jgi:hypothetical protein